MALSSVPIRKPSVRCAMANMPPDIWLYITDFIPDEVIYQLRCVNPVFFELALNYRWKDVTVSTRRAPEYMSTLERLSDPFIAKRVRALTIHLTMADPVESSSILTPSILQNVELSKLEMLKKQGIIFPKMGLHSLGTIDTLDFVIHASARMTNLRRLTLDFSNISTSFQLGTESFCRSLWSLFGKKLRQLFLKGAPNGYRAVLGSKPAFPALKELSMEFVNNPKISDAHGEDGTNVVDDVLLPFLSKLNPRLEALRIRSRPSHSSKPIDLSQFFIHIPMFSSLRSLDIHMPFNESLGDPSGLKDFLWKNSNNLRSLSLRLNPSGFALPWTIEDKLVPWLSECLTDPQAFSQLQRLDIYPTGSGFDVVLGYIKRASRNLEQIVVRDRYFETDEVELIVDAASDCPNLTSLHLNVWELDVNLTDQLFTKLPSIESLRISTVESFADGYPRIFVENLSERYYTGWKLRDVSVCYGEREVDSRTMRALAKSIPSVSSFFGRGHMRFEIE